jgi:DNA polymerase I-like protein with 3'-5' exonuclease and polymerase domains
MAGLKTRDQAKTFIYGLLYGAGDAKVGKIIEGSVADGARLKNQFKRQVPAYAKLLNQLEYVTAQRGFLKGLDGRPLPVRSAHSALNLLLQSAGAVVMKQALYILDNELYGLYPGRYAFMANVHDEWQIECEPQIAEKVGQLACEAIAAAGGILDLKCPLKGEFKIGNNWAETH